MTFLEYSELADKTAMYPHRGSNLIYPALGLCGETGEVAEKVKKLWRDCDGRVDYDTKEALIKELGDILWYINAACFELKTTLDNVALVNLCKLQSRKERGVLGGSGDER